MLWLRAQAFKILRHTVRRRHYSGLAISVHFGVGETNGPSSHTSPVLSTSSRGARNCPTRCTRCVTSRSATNAVPIRGLCPCGRCTLLRSSWMGSRPIDQTDTPRQTRVSIPGRPRSSRARSYHSAARIPSLGFEGTAVQQSHDHAIGDLTHKHVFLKSSGQTIKCQRSDFDTHHRVPGRLAVGFPFGLQRVVHVRVQGQTAQVKIDFEIGPGQRHVELTVDLWKTGRTRSCCRTISI